MFIRVHPWLKICSKKIKKNVDARPAFWDIGLTHGNNRTTTQNKMRTKTLLLTAAALLAAGIVSIQAQPVYSQNIVGYANLPTAGSSTYLISVPFVIGASNGANEIWPAPGGVPTLPDGSEILLWNGTGYDIYFSDSGSPSLWDNQGGPIPNSPLLPVGKGFFLIPALNTTNVFAGTVSVNVGSSNVMTLAGSSTYLVSPVVPYAGSFTNGNPTTGAGGPGLSINSPNGGMPDGSEVLIWNGTGYNIYFSDSASPSLWDNQGGPIPTAPTINVGQGIFIIPAAQFKWTVGL